MQVVSGNIGGPLALSSQRPFEIDGNLGSIPNLPGYGYKRKAKYYPRNQTFNYCNGLPIEQKEGVTFERPKLVVVQKQVESRRLGNTFPESTTAEHYKESAPQTATFCPAWDVLDRHALRFYGYFQEAVVEANLENYRIRQCVLYYYLEDDTAQMTEKKVNNSGMPSGPLVRRHRLPGPDGRYLQWQDLVVGMDLPMYGRVIRLTDCDPWTREFYANEGFNQPPSSEVEQDNFSRSIGRFGPSAPSRTYESNYREVAFGGGHVNTDMQQFLEYDGKVLRFYAVMDDLSMFEFTRRPFVILYFLADDTVEIREQYPLNCGRDNFPIFFRRARMPRGRVELAGPMKPVKKKDECICATDFSIGKLHEFIGYQFYVYDCDEFTRQYFAEELGMPLLPAQDVRLPERKVNRPPTPPYTGYGSWDDSMGSVQRLVPKPPRKDLKKLYENEGKILRYTARYYDGKPEDEGRVFVINYHLFDDTVSIHEPPQRNNGIITGRYLEKSVHLNQATGELFKPEDFDIGCVVKVYNREFEILGMDEYTANFMNGKDGSRKYDLVAVLEKIREGLRQMMPLARDIFRRVDLDHDGVLTFDDFKTVLEKWGFLLKDEDVLVLMKHFDTRKDGQISYNEFCDALLDEDFTTEMCKQKPRLVDKYDPAYGAKAFQKTVERQETEKVRSAARRLGDVIYKQIQAFTKLMKEFQKMTHEPTVTSKQIVQALHVIGHDFLLEDVERALLYLMPSVDLNKVNYVEFLKSVTTSYHDLSGSR